MSQHGRDFEKQGNCYGFSYMDGVPVKIGERYKPPKKYNLPVGFMQKLPTDTITEQYDFQLEKSVLEKIGEWQNIRKAAIEDRRKRIEADNQAIQEQAEKFKELSVVSSTHPGLGFEELTVKDPLSNSSKVDSPKIVTQETSQLPDTPSDKVIEDNREIDDNSQNSVVTMYGQLVPSQSHQYTSSNILTPTPYGSFLNKKKDLVPTSFNLSDFEADTSSPFDNMELKTLNDMEELAYVLQPLSNSPKVKEIPQTNNPSQLSFYSPNMAVQQNHQRNAQVSSLTAVQSVGEEILGKNMPQINGISSYSLYGTIPRNQMQPVNHIKNEETHNSAFGPFEDVNYHFPINSMQNSTLHRGSTHGCYLEYPWDTKRSVESTTCRARLSQGFSANKGNMSVMESNDLMSSGSSLSRPTKNTDNNNMYALPVSFYFSPQNQTPHFTNDKVAILTNSDSRSLRVSKSVPDIIKELETELNKQPVIQVSQRHNCNTPPLGEAQKGMKEFEKWRPWPKLDSPVNPSQMLSDNFPVSFETRVTSKTDIQNAGTVSSLPNPFAELSPTAQRLVKHISEMGFSIPRVSRACQMFGEDDKKIVEYLLQVQSLEERSYPSDLVEQSLISNNYDEAETINYMNLVAQLMGLGFTENQVIQALTINENDGEKALDYLVS